MKWIYFKLDTFFSDEIQQWWNVEMCLQKSDMAFIWKNDIEVREND